MCYYTPRNRSDKYIRILSNLQLPSGEKQHNHLTGTACHSLFPLLLVPFVSLKKTGHFDFPLVSRGEDIRQKQTIARVR